MGFSTKDQYKVVIEKWFEHNPKSKKGYTHFMLSKRIFNDEKIANLKPIEFQLYLYCLSICADMSSNQFTISAQMVPKYLRISAKSLHNCLSRLQSFQLLSFSQNGVSYIKEEKRIEKKEIEEKEKKVPSDPFFKKSFDPKKLPKAAEIWNDNCGHLTKLTGTTRNWNDRSDRLLTDYGEIEFARVVKLVSSNPFLSGQNNRKWKVTFSWLIDPDNFGKVLAGDYDTANGIESIMAQLEKAFGEAS
ncbi:MAG: hypothetical protein ACXVCP_00250 [Bdellovibrio sp.]